MKHQSIGARVINGVMSCECE